MIEFKPVENLIRSGGEQIEPMIQYLMGVVKEHSENIINCTLEKKVLNVHQRKMIDIRSNYVDNYIVTFFLNNEKRYIYKIIFPKIFNKQFTVLNGVFRIPLIQMIDKAIYARNKDKINKVKLWNNIIKLNIIPRIKKEKSSRYITVFIDRKHNYEFFHLLFEKHGGVKQFIKNTFGKFGVSLKPGVDKLEPGKKMYEYMDFEASLLTDKKFRVFADYSSNNEYKKINSKAVWKNENRYIHSKSIVEYFEFSNKLDIFSDTAGYGLDLFDVAFDYLFSDNKEIISKNNIKFKRPRHLEIFFIEILKEFSNMLFVNKKFRGKTDIIKRTIDIPNKICSDPNITSIQQTLVPNYNPIYMLGECNKISYSGPEGIAKGSVSIEQRNLHDSYKYNICPIITPDREKTGVVNQVTVNNNLLETKKKK